MIDSGDDNRSEGEAQAQLDSIRAMVTRLEHASASHDIDDCELAHACPECVGGEIQIVNDGEIVSEDCPECDATVRVWYAGDFDGLDFDDYHDEDQAREAIYEDTLSVQVRSDWASHGADFEAAEFQILLCTGGPAVRIRGALNAYGEPTGAWLEHQDWFTPWAEYHGDHDDDALLAYSAQVMG